MRVETAWRYLHPRLHRCVLFPRTSWCRLCLSVCVCVYVDNSVPLSCSVEVIYGSKLRLVFSQTKPGTIASLFMASCHRSCLSCRILTTTFRISTYYGIAWVSDDWRNQRVHYRLLGSEWLTSFSPDAHDNRWSRLGLFGRMKRGRDGIDWVQSLTGEMWVTCGEITQRQLGLCLLDTNKTILNDSKVHKFFLTETGNIARTSPQWDTVLRRQLLVLLFLGCHSVVDFLSLIICCVRLDDDG